jgi:putative endonuclease
MPKVFTSKTQKLGELGEGIACKYLQNKGFFILDRNYTKKWGEIDIIAKKGNTVHIIEVKSVSCETLPDVTRETIFDKNQYNPAENMHPIKLKKLLRTAEIYMVNRGDELDWQLDLYCVYIQLKDRMARVKVIENLII